MYIIGFTIAICCFVSAFGRFISRSWNGITLEIKTITIVGLLGLTMVYYDVTSPVVTEQEIFITTHTFKYNLGCGEWKIKIEKITPTRFGAIYRMSKGFTVLEQLKRCDEK